MTSIVPQCMVCRHFKKRGRGVFECDAYPVKIPREILLNEVDHRKPYEGDQGVQFEAVDGSKSPLDDS